MEVVQYIGGCSVHRRDNISPVGDSFSTVEVAQFNQELVGKFWPGIMDRE